MAVTEKCDVYSFGVVMLETLMGRHPRELLSLLSSSSSTPSAQNTLLIEVLDQRLPPPRNRLIEGDIVLICALAFACINAKPKCRPTMKHISQQLLARKRLLAMRFSEVTLGQLMMPKVYMDIESNIITSEIQ